MHTTEEVVGSRKVKVQKFFEKDIFYTNMLQEDQVALIEELQTRIALLKQAGLESAARAEEGELAYYRYCLNNAELRQQEDFGIKLTGKQVRKVSCGLSVGLASSLRRYGRILYQTIQAGQ